MVIVCGVSYLSLQMCGLLHMLFLEYLPLGSLTATPQLLGLYSLETEVQTECRERKMELLKEKENP